jgi:AcrR family transcriptional regulator
VEADVVQADVVQIASRRDRVRAATSLEIIQTARRLLVDQGSAAISLRAIAREMGMTAPALYRYFGSHEALIEHVIADIFTELTDHLKAAIAAVGSAAVGDAAVGSADAGRADAGRADAGGAPAGAGPDMAGPDADLIAAQLLTACQAFRDWALAHPPEFGMIFGSPLPGLDLVRDDPLAECGFRFGQIFVDLFDRLWRLRPFPVPPEGEIDASFRPQLAHYRDLIGSELPLGALQTFLRCWVLLYGTVSLEVFGHLRFALEDAAPMFQMMLIDMAAMIGLGYPLPA